MNILKILSNRRKKYDHQVGVGRSTRELRPDTNNAVFDSRVLSKHQVGTCGDFFCLGIFVSSLNNGYWKLEI